MAHPTPSNPAGDPHGIDPAGGVIDTPEDALLLEDLRVVLDRRQSEKTTTEESANDLTGRYVGAYQVGELLGEGGLARVYKATHVADHRHVAFKILKPQYRIDSKICARFEREARTMARIHHEHVVRILDFPRDDSIQAIVMEFFSGGTLRDKLNAALSARSTLRVDQAVTYVVQAAAGIGAAHANGIVHRDIKPSNLLLSSDARIHVADFGAILILEHATWLTGVGQQIGTPAYMSPEQCKGDRVTPASDIYSLAVTLFELLTGRLPFEVEEASPFAIMLKHISEPPPDPRTWQPDISDELAAVVLKSLAKNAEDRYVTAEAFTKALVACPLKRPKQRAHPPCDKPAWSVDVAGVRKQLQSLPQRAIVCWACRCAQRVQQLAPDPQIELALKMAQSTVWDSDEMDPSQSVSQALRRIRALRATSLQAAYVHEHSDQADVAKEVARSAAAAAACGASLCIADAAADAAFAARSAIAALIHAGQPVKPFWDAARNDFQRLAAAKLGKEGSMGKPIPADLFHDR